MKLALLLLLLLPFSAMAQNKPGLDAPLTDAQIKAGDLERAKELMKVDSKALTNESGVDVNPDIEIHLKLKR